MTKPANANQALIDILPVTPPTDATPLLLWFTAIIILAVIMLLWLKWRRSPRQHALRQLNTIRNQLTKSQVSSKSLALEIRQALKKGLQTNHINRDATNPFHPDFMLRLTRCCYQSIPPSQDELSVLIDQAHHWLTKQGRN